MAAKKSGPRPRLNFKKDFAEVRGHSDARFIQDGYYFDYDGVCVGEVDKKFTRNPQRKTILDRIQEKKEDVLARAEDALAQLEGEPKEVIEARRENARAAAAEGNAE